MEFFKYFSWNNKSLVQYDISAIYVTSIFCIDIHNILLIRNKNNETVSQKLVELTKCHVITVFETIIVCGFTHIVNG